MIEDVVRSATSNGPETITSRPRRQPSPSRSQETNGGVPDMQPENSRVRYQRAPRSSASLNYGSSPLHCGSLTSLAAR
jgi:hypothetical protein